MKRCLLLLLLAGWVDASQALAPSSLIANVPGRATVSLNGAWRAIVDQFENSKSAGFFRDANPHSKSDRRVQFRCVAGSEPAGMVERMPNLAGLTPWVLMDFRSPARMLPGVQDYHNRKGLISNRGQRKLAFYTRQKFYRKLADAGK
jgi:hypothetical protein